MTQLSIDMTQSLLLHISHVKGYAIPAYCFMPDHVHLLVRGTSEGSDLVAFVHDWKQRSGFAYKRTTGERLWQDGYHDRLLRHDDDPVRCIRYIVENPVRAGLSGHPNEYPYWGSTEWTREEIIELLNWEDQEAGLRPGYG